jgi:hypothetical protein
MWYERYSYTLNQLVWVSWKSVFRNTYLTEGSQTYFGVCSIIFIRSEQNLVWKLPIHFESACMSFVKISVPDHIHYWRKTKMFWRKICNVQPVRTKFGMKGTHTLWISWYWVSWKSGLRITFSYKSKTKKFYRIFCNFHPVRKKFGIEGSHTFWIS